MMGHQNAYHRIDTLDLVILPTKLAVLDIWMGSEIPICRVLDSKRDSYNRLLLRLELEMGGQLYKGQRVLSLDFPSVLLIVIVMGWVNCLYDSMRMVVLMDRVSRQYCDGCRGVLDWCSIHRLVNDAIGDPWIPPG
jgi:hypothetical protein